MRNGLNRCVLLADRQHHLSEGLRALLKATFDNVFIVADQASLLEGARRLAPALVMIDLSLAQGTLAELLAALRTRAPGAKLLLLSAHDEPAVARAAAAAGADALLVTRGLATELLPTIDALLAGRKPPEAQGSVQTAAAS